MKIIPAFDVYGILSTLLASLNTLLTIWASKRLISQTFGERNSSNLHTKTESNLA
jgi:hypothetical protein